MKLIIKGCTAFLDVDNILSGQTALSWYNLHMRKCATCAICACFNKITTDQTYYGPAGVKGSLVRIQSSRPEVSQVRHLVPDLFLCWVTRWVTNGSPAVFLDDKDMPFYLPRPTRI